LCPALLMTSLPVDNPVDQTLEESMRSIRRAVAAVAALAVLSLAAPAVAADVVVDERSLGSGWEVATTGAGSTAFVDGAIELSTRSDVQDRASISTMVPAGTRLADVGALGYEATTVSASFAGGAAALRLVIDLDGVPGGDWTTLVHEPYWQNGGVADAAPVVIGERQSWDAAEGLWWSSRTVGGLTAGAGGPPFYSLDDVLALNPDAVVGEVNVGIGSYNVDYLVQVHSLTVGESTYLFTRRPFEAADCKDGGWQNAAQGPFRNQGDCVSFYASNGRTHG
jgi:hypothetical protein